MMLCADGEAGLSVRYFYYRMVLDCYLERTVLSRISGYAAALWMVLAIPGASIEQPHACAEASQVAECLPFGLRYRVGPQ